jgi:cytochrome P450
MAVAGSTHCELLGLAPSESDRFVRPASIVIDPDRTLEEQMAAWEELSSFVRGVARAKAEHPGNDLISDLVRGGELSDDEIVGCSIALFTAGVDVTASMIALGALVLLCNRAELDKLRADPTIIDSAVEELLRYVSIFQIGAFPRTALEDLDLEGTPIGTGESVTVSIAAANRDPSKFDDPDTLDLTRLTRGHLAFGYGRHMCLGQHLARLELQIALSRLFSRFATLELAVPFEDLDLFGGEHIAYGVRKLPVTWQS